MQVSVSFRCNNLTLPVHYNHIIQGFIYNSVRESRLGSFLHNDGFSDGTRRFKLFTFSRVGGKYLFDREAKTITFPERCHITVASIVDDFIDVFLKKCLFSTDLRINGQKVEVEEVEFDRLKNIKEKVKVRTLSPVVVYSTVTIDGRKKTIYHSPQDKIFKEQLEKNLKRKARVAGMTGYEGEIKVSTVEDVSSRQVISYYKDFIIKGWMGEFILEGDPLLIKIALGCGLGAKNSQGFGCVKLAGRSGY